jgi:murein DD-endopeptidase MepM/ murein hydrolase activator NlpD
MKIKYIIFTFLTAMVVIVCYVGFTKVEYIAPVKGSTKNSYSQNDFLSPRDGHKHKGIDIFAKSGTPVISAAKGIVVYTGIFKIGGKIVLIMDPHLRYHYYAHLSEIETHKFAIVDIGAQIGKVGNTGNAIHTPSHLHYSISNPFKLYDYDVKGEHNKIPYLNPILLLNDYFNKKK